MRCFGTINSAANLVSAVEEIITLKSWYETWISPLVRLSVLLPNYAQEAPRLLALGAYE